MVYESDFYTTRRPYSSRPLVSSYSVTSPYRIISIPSVPRVYTYTSTYPIYSGYPTVFHHSIPYVAHKRLVTGTRLTPTRVFSTRVISTPIRSVTPFRSVTPYRSVRSVTPLRVITSPSRYTRSYSTSRVIASPTRTFSVRVRPSVLHREYKRIENKYRTNPHYSATENYLNSDSVRAFDDETNDIRNATNALMRKVHQRVERSHSLFPSFYSSKYERRYGPDSFVSSISGPLKSTVYNGIESYNPHKYIGPSHLASVRIVGNKAYNTRRATSYYDDDKIRNDVQLLSFYLKNRKAAAENKEPVVVLDSAKLKAEVNEGPEITEVV